MIYTAASAAWLWCRLAAGTDYNAAIRKSNEVFPGIYTALGLVIVLAQVAGRRQQCIMFGGMFAVAMVVPLLTSLADFRTKRIMARTVDSCQTEEEALAMCIVHVGVVTRSGTRDDDMRLVQLVGEHCAVCKDPDCPLTMGPVLGGDEGCRKRRAGYLWRIVRKCIEKFPRSTDLRLLEVILLLDCAKDGLVAWVTIRQLLHSSQIGAIEAIHLIRYK